MIKYSAPKKLPQPRKISPESKQKQLISYDKQFSKTNRLSSEQSSNFTHEIFNKNKQMPKSMEQLQILRQKPLISQYRSSQQLKTRQIGTKNINQYPQDLQDLTKYQRLEKDIQKHHYLGKQRQKNANKSSYSTQSASDQINFLQNRQIIILDHKNQSNVKFLIAQTKQLLSYSKFMVLEEETNQINLKSSELNIQIRRLRINMRNQCYTNQINFTFPIQKHNDQIRVKMPQQINPKQMKKYQLVRQRLDNELQKQKQLNQKILKFDEYIELLTNKSILKSQKNNQSKQQSFQAIQKALFCLQKDQKLQKSISSQTISLKYSKNTSSKQSISTNNQIKTNSIGDKRMNSKNISKKTSDNYQQNQLQNKKYQTLLLKKQNLQQILHSYKGSSSQKIARLQSEIDLLRKQNSLVNQNIQKIQQRKNKLINQIQIALKKKSNQNKIKTKPQEQTLNLINRQKKLYQKQKISRNINQNGFTQYLRQNKSVSPTLIHSKSNKLKFLSPETKHIKIH